MWCNGTYTPSFGLESYMEISFLHNLYGAVQLKIVSLLILKQKYKMLRCSKRDTSSSLFKFFVYSSKFNVVRTVTQTGDEL